MVVMFDVTTPWKREHAMTKEQGTLERIDWKAVLTSDPDVFRSPLQTVVQEVLEAEMTEALQPRRASAFGLVDIVEDRDAASVVVETMTTILSRELHGRSITVNAVAPRPTCTLLLLNGKSRERIERLAKDESRGTPGNPGRHRRRGRIPHRPGRGMDQWSGPARQWRHGLTNEPSRFKPAVERTWP